MLYYPFKNYEGFKEMFIREDGLKKNKVLLAFLKSRDVMKFLREEGGMEKFFTIDTIQKMEDFCESRICATSYGETYILINNRTYWNNKYRIDNYGFCEDMDISSYRYYSVELMKVYKMKTSKMYAKLIEMSAFGRILPTPVKLWMCEKIQREWEIYARKHLREDEYTLHIDYTFDKIYKGRYLKGDFGSCMTNKGREGFYKNSVIASSAYITDKEDMIVARCVIFLEVHDVETGEVLRLAERQYSSDGKEYLKRILIDKLIQEKAIDGYKKINADCGSSRAFVSVDGEDWSYRKFSIECSLAEDDTLSYQDSFKWYDICNNIAYNHYVSCYDYMLDTIGEAIASNYDEYNDEYTSDRVVDVYCDGRWMTCSENCLDDFRYIEGTGWVYYEDTSYCEECGEYYLDEDGCYSGITGRTYCCDYCKKDAEKDYMEENWYYSEYDGMYFENGNEVTEMIDRHGDIITISVETLDEKIRCGEVVMDEEEGMYKQI